MKAQTHPDVALVGAGIMSATLATLLKQVQPGLTMEIFESLDSVAGESSNAWNNVGSPPMSVPHLDTRVIDGKRSLLFGPYARFSTKFLKHGSAFDLPDSVRIHPWLGNCRFLASDPEHINGCFHKFASCADLQS